MYLAHLTWHGIRTTALVNHVSIGLLVIQIIVSLVHTATMNLYCRLVDTEMFLLIGVKLAPVRKCTFICYL